MKTASSTWRILGASIFAIGVLLSTLLTGGLTWAGLEATLYGFERYTPNRFDGLSCPPLMTRSETGVVHVAVNNPSDKIITPIMTIDLSTPALPDTEQVQITVPPGQTRQLEWTVSRENIDRRFFIFAKANRSASYPVDTAEALCGILVLDVPSLNGMQVLSIWLALCLLSTPLGLWLWNWGTDRHTRLQGVMKALAIAALGGLLVSLLGLWMLGVLALTVTMLLAVGLLRFVARV